MNRTIIAGISITLVLGLSGCGDPKPQQIQVSAPTQQLAVDNLSKKNIFPNLIVSTPSPKQVPKKTVKPHIHKKFIPEKASRSRRATQSSKKLTENSVWDRLATCEAGGNWSINTGNGYYGGLQFSLSSWKAVGGSGLPSNASRQEQISKGKRLQSVQGWGAWPACSRKLGLR